MRVLFLASYFPRPTKPLMGTWALEQAKALAHICDLQVACCTSYLPTPLKILPKARPWIDLPPTHTWDAGNGKSVPVRYFKSLYYPIPPFKRWAHAAPQRQMNLAWRSVRRRLQNLVAEFHPDLLYSHHTAVNGYFAYRLQQTTGLPYIIIDHDFAEIADCAHLPQRRAFFQPILQHASVNVSVAKRMEADFQRIFPHARTLTVPNGINPLPPEIFSIPRPKELLNRTILFSAGMFAPRKGFPLLIDAFAKIAPKHPNAILRIAGDGQDRPAIEAAIARHQLQDRVQLLGLQPHRQIFQEMAWSDAFALIAWDEPFGVVYVEAMATAKPILAAADCGINDVVQNQIHGLIVPPKNLDAAAAALDTLLANPQQRQQMGQNAQALAQSLTWQANANKMLALFQQATSGQLSVAGGQ